MAKHQTVRIRPAFLRDDTNVLHALTGIPSYAPNHPACTKVAVQAKHEAMLAARAAESAARAALAAARDTAAAAEWDFHNTILMVKDQVIAQYGNDSNEVQALGLKKRSERTKPGPKRGRRSNTE